MPALKLVGVAAVDDDDLVHHFMEVSAECRHHLQREPRPPLLGQSCSSGSDHRKQKHLNNSLERKNVRQKHERKMSDKRKPVKERSVLKTDLDENVFLVILTGFEPIL